MVTKHAMLHSALSVSTLLVFVASGAFSHVVRTLHWAEVARVPLGRMLGDLLVVDATWMHPGIVGAFVLSAGERGAVAGAGASARRPHVLWLSPPSRASPRLRCGEAALHLLRRPPGSRNLGRMHLGDVLLLSLVLAVYVGCLRAAPSRVRAAALPLGAVALALPAAPPCMRSASRLRYDAPSVAAAGAAVLALLPTMHAVKEERQEYSAELFEHGTPLELFAWCHIIGLALWLLLVHAPLVHSWLEGAGLLLFVACVNHNVAAATALLLVGDACGEEAPHILVAAVANRAGRRQR